ncbi:MAG: ATP-binding protein [Bacteroidota bacterium]|nr:ATP-binding protein [Bacteroidota bacterium]MDP3144079.1 ATP-binding protein [Bacteroidota bacterium]
MFELETYKAVFDSAPDGLIVTNNLGEIILVNNKIEKLFGYKAKELIGKKIELLIPNRFHHNHTEQRTDYANAPTAREMGAKKNLWALKKDGSEFAVEISLSPIKLKDANLMSAAIRDVSERKKIEQEIAVQYKKLESQNKELEQFTYIASHDLREPLQTLNSFVKLIKDEFAGKLGDQGDKYLEFIFQSSSRMQDLVKGLMDYSLIGKEPEIKLVDCNIIVNEVLSDLNYSIKESDALILVKNLPEINGYPTELRQLFQNLISNALKYRRNDIDLEIVISAEKSGNSCLFSIKDNGIGIDKDDKEKIFTLFKRLHNRDEYSGIGVGLSYCKKIVEIHNGNIWVDSTPGEGSTFYFTIHTN